MCENCASPKPSANQTASKRLRLWEFDDNAHCPVIGTCLSHDDLMSLAKRLKLQVRPDVHDYDLHGFFVSASMADCPEARAIHKLLDRRHEGAVRKFSRLTCRGEQLALWEEMKDGGQVAAGFYAVMTLRTIAEDVRARVFAEVHMLSHLLGATHRQNFKEMALLREQLASERKKRERLENSFHEALEQREQKISDLQQSLLREQTSAARNTSTTKSAQKNNTNRSKVERALEIARSRARLAEAENTSLHAELDRLRGLLARSGRRSYRQKNSIPGEMAPIRLEGRSILYIGGRENQVSHMRQIAEKYGASFIHHDGGIESAYTRIDAILPSVDCVLCPVNCISHDACLRAKSACKKFGKRFIPLRNASQTSFRLALEGVGRDFTSRETGDQGPTRKRNLRKCISP